MWIFGLICIVAILVLLFCLRGFHQAMKEKGARWTVIVNTEELERFPRTRGKSSHVRFQDGMRRLG